MQLAIFDLDGTLVDSAPDIHAALNRLMATQGLGAFDLPAVAAMIGDGAHALLVKAHAARGVPLPEAVIPPFLEDLEANSAVLTRPYPGMVEALETLAATGWRRAICTNKPIAATMALLGTLDLARHFDCVFATPEGAIIQPSSEAVIRTVLQSEAAQFVQDPPGFIEKAVRLDREDR